MRSEHGLVQVNAITLLAGFILVLIVVMGGYTFATPSEPVQVTSTPDESGPYRVVVTESSVGIEKLEGDPVVYDQIVVYVSAGGTNQQLQVAEEFARGDDGDSLFERNEAVRRPLNASIAVGTSVSVKVVDAGGSDILYETTVNATAASDE